MIFTSDNAFGVAPEILDAIARANMGAVPSYGEDEITKRLQGRFAEIFEHEVAVFPVATGTAANALALATLTPPYGAVLCHEHAHVHVDECGAPEMFTGGAKLVGVSGAAAKLDPQALEAALATMPAGNVHNVQPTTLTVTQSTESGTVYTLGELRRLTGIAEGRGLAVHMDGARFANALVSLGCSPAEMTWKAGIDVLSFGATKNGALAAEAVVFFDPARAVDFAFRRKRAGHLFSKMRFVSAQLEAYLDDDLWLRNAAHANALAKRLADGLALVNSARLQAPVDANELFVRLPRGTLKRLREAGAGFHPWPMEGDDAENRTIRLVTSFATRGEDVDRLLQVVSS
ncbi:low specificity L-threonine aldolase [Parvibaculum sedimenti]|uniref:L-threonine aldolase n=1 Tax=Parvibaculum sedimenti TaxID=2608632 RepID=A0A6N6VNH5_9HYPH|nr:low specificity L-threonine aldolase [Parvibaculum sedimenti]KAB7740702.1 low specificity L-threonine aldolase [Parvibaculum sedimenti]